MKDKIMNIFSSKGFMIAVSFLGLYLLTTGTSWAVFSYLKKEPSISVSLEGLEKARSGIAELPKTEECPINGAMFTKPEREIWESRRPITSVIENHLDSRPQSGISRADVVHEVVAEGGITRFLAVYYCNSAAEDVRIGPVRSVRVYFIDWASDYGDRPLFVHSGGANNICSNCPRGVKAWGDVAPKVDAINKLIKIGWRDGSYGNDIDAGTNAGFPQVWRDPERIPGAAYEHTFMGSTDKLFDLGATRGFGYKDSEGSSWDESFTKWQFTDESPLSSAKASEISFEFWSNKSDYDVVWKYDSGTNSYLRFHGNKKHIDMDAEEQLSAKNVAIQFVREEGPVDKEGHMFYTTVGEGEALIFQNGDVIEGTWEKESASSRTMFYNESGAEIEFVRGVTWIEAVPKGNEIKY
jgi:hypothetical protein